MTTTLLRSLSRSFINLIEPNVHRFINNSNNNKAVILSNSANSINHQQIRGFKDKGVLQLRCSKCYFKKLDDRWWVLCNEFPRHKQRQKVEDHREKWIVTHLTRGGRPFQKKPEAYICNTSPPGAYGNFNFINFNFNLINYDTFYCLLIASYLLRSQETYLEY